jgi:predicted O-linked N-acetylglucosamine transferase (SPINDLY family)
MESTDKPKNALRASHVERRAEERKAEGHFSDAIELYLETIKLRCDKDCKSFVNLAACYLGVGDKKAALECYVKALNCNPQNVEILNLIGVFFLQEAEYERAIKIFLIALQIDDQNSLVRLNISSAFREIGNYRRALEEIQCILEINQNFAEAHNNKGCILMYRREYEEAEKEFKIALSINNNLLTSKSNYLYCSNYNPALSADELFERYSAHNFPDNVKKPPNASQKIFKRRGDKIRIGYISPDFRNSSVAFYFLPILKNHNRRKFELIGFGGSWRNDFVHNEIRGLFDHYFVIDGLPEFKIDSLIRDCEIDFLVDLAGHSAGSYLRALKRKPAQIQATTLGYGFATGLNYIDYFIADATLVPVTAERYYTEELLLIDSPFPYAFPKSGGNTAPLPARRNGFITFGCLSRSIRLNEQVISTWSRILHSIPSAKLILNCRDFRDDFERQLLIKKFEKFDIDKERLSIGFSSPPWDLYDRIDIALDCFPHNSGTTLIEGIFKGVPFITLCGVLSMQRIGLSLLKRLNLEEFVAISEDQYVDIAVKLSHDLDKVDFLRRTLRARAIEIFETNGSAFVKGLEDKIQWMFAS